MSAHIEHSQVVQALETAILKALVEIEGCSAASSDTAKRARAARAAFSDLPPDTALMDYIVRKGVRGGTYEGITSIDVIVRVSDLAQGRRYAITRAMEREADGQRQQPCSNYQGRTNAGE